MHGSDMMKDGINKMLDQQDMIEEEPNYYVQEEENTCRCECSNPQSDWDRFAEKMFRKYHHARK
jgi:hypothetical protein